MPDFKKNTTPAMKKTMAYSKTDPTAFKMRSGNGPLAFKEMGASTPAKGLMDMLGSFGGGDQASEMSKMGEKINKPINENIITLDDSKTDKIKAVDLKIKDTGKMSSTSSRPEGTEAVTKEPNPNETKTEAKPKKKGLWGRYKDHVGSEAYHQVKDSANELANVVDKSTVRDTTSAQRFNKNLADKNKLKLDKIKSDKEAKEKGEKTKREIEMHDTNIAYKQQQTKTSAQTEATSKALENKRINSSVQIQKDADSGVDEVESTPSFNEDFNEEYNNENTQPYTPDIKRNLA